MTNYYDQLINKLTKKLAVADVTSRALELSGARFRGLFDALHSGVAIYSPRDEGRDFIFVDINTAAEKIGGFRKEEVIGRSVFDFFPGIDDSGLLAIFRQVWQTGEPERHSTYKYDGDQLVIWWDNYVYKLPSDEIIVVHDDITERKKTESKIFAYQDQLQSLTSELSLAEERERRRIARDLHDQIGQLLSVIKMKLHSLREGIMDQKILGELDEARELLDKTIQETRTLTFELSPPVLYELGLEAALEWLVEKFRGQHAIDCTYTDISRNGKIDDVVVGTILFRAVRELLFNIAKHAQASKVMVSIRKSADRVEIFVDDNGIGFDIQKRNTQITRSLGLGLFNIRERLERLGGSLGIESVIGKGTRVTLVAPLKEGKD